MFEGIDTHPDFDFDLEGAREEASVPSDYDINDRIAKLDVGIRERVRAAMGRLLYGAETGSDELVDLILENDLPELRLEAVRPSEALSGSATIQSAELGHPGTLINALLEQRDISVAALSDQLGVGRNQVHRVIRGDSGVSPAMANGLANLGFGPDAEGWLILQARFDLSKLHKAVRQPRRPKRPATERLLDDAGAESFDLADRALENRLPELRPAAVRSSDGFSHVAAEVQTRRKMNPEDRTAFHAASDAHPWTIEDGRAAARRQDRTRLKKHHPLWVERDRYPNLAHLSAPRFLRAVYPDAIDRDGRLSNEELVRGSDPTLVGAVQGYINTKIERSQPLGDAEGLVFTRRDGRGRPKKRKPSRSLGVASPD